MLLAGSPQKPILFACHCATFHYEWAAPSNTGWLQELVAELRAWVGSQLRWSWVSAFPVFEPYNDDCLSILERYGASLETPLAESSHAYATLHAASHGDLHIGWDSNEQLGWPSPVFLEIYGKMFATPSGLVSRLSIKVGVELQASLIDFRERFERIIANTPITWANAGLGYSGAYWMAYPQTLKAVRAHSIRHPGFDIGLELGHLEQFARRIRSVSWLTAVDKALVPQWDAHQEKGIRIRLVGPAVIVQAGDAPEPGDTNRLILPEAYADVDRMLMHVRAREVNLLPPWTQRESNRWLNRFELWPQGVLESME